MPLRGTPRMVTFHVNRFIGSLIAKLACAGSNTREDWVYGSSCRKCMFKSSNYFHHPIASKRTSKWEAGAAKKRRMCSTKLFWHCRTYRRCLIQQASPTSPGSGRYSFVCKPLLACFQPKECICCYDQATMSIP